MSSAGSTLWSIVKAVLWFALRLALLAATGRWVGSPREALGEEEAEAPPAGPRPAQAARSAMGAGAPESGPSGESSEAAEATRRSLSADAPASGVSSGAFERAADGLQTRLVRLRDATLRMRHAGAIPDAIERLEVQLQEIREELRSLGVERATWAKETLRAMGTACNFLEQAIENRMAPEVAGWLAEVDEIAADTLAPVRQVLDAHGAGYEARAWVASSGAVRERHLQTLWATGVGPLKVEPRLDEHPELWPLIGARAARGLFVDVPGLADELYDRHGLPSASPLPLGQIGYGPEELHAALGAWLEPLFCDVYATTRFGPAYGYCLAQTLASPGRPQRAGAASARGAWLSPIPPPTLRMHAVTRVIEVLGLRKEASHLWQSWVDQHGETEQFFLPTADGSWNSIPADYLTAQTDQVLDPLLHEPIAALAEQSLMQVPGLAFVHSEQANHLRLREQFARGDAERHGPHVVVGAAALAVLLDGAAVSTVAPAARSIIGIGRDAGVERHDVYSLGAAHPHSAHPYSAHSHLAQADSARSANAGPPPSLRAALRNKRLVWEALVIGSALAPRKPGATAFRRGSRPLRPQRR